MERLDEAEDLVLCTMNPWMMLKLLRRLCAILKLMEDGFGLTTQSPSALIPQPLEFTWGGPHIQGVVEVADVGTTEEVDTVVVAKDMAVAVDMVDTMAAMKGLGLNIATALPHPMWDPRLQAIVSATFYSQLGEHNQ